MTKDQIKKEIYKQNPTADFNYENSEFKNYSIQIVIDVIEEIIEFRIPIKECKFNETVPAQLLIEWLVN